MNKNSFWLTASLVGSRVTVDVQIGGIEFHIGYDVETQNLAARLETVEPEGDNAED